MQFWFYLRLYNHLVCFRCWFKVWFLAIAKVLKKKQTNKQKTETSKTITSNVHEEEPRVLLLKFKNGFQTPRTLFDLSLPSDTFATLYKYWSRGKTTSEGVWASLYIFGNKTLVLEFLLLPQGNALPSCYNCGPRGNKADTMLNRYKEDRAGQREQLHQTKLEDVKEEHFSKKIIYTYNPNMPPGKSGNERLSCV